MEYVCTDCTCRLLTRTCRRFTSFARMKAPITFTFDFFRCSTNSSWTCAVITMGHTANQDTAKTGWEWVGGWVRAA